MKFWKKKVPPKWPRRLTIIRHGESEQNKALDLFDEDLGEELERLANTRDMDIELTGLGGWQAKKTGEYLAGEEEFDICFCSPYRRTVQTAEEITNKLPYELEIFEDERIREKEFGRLHNLTREQIKEIYPEEYAARQRDGKYWYRMKGGENYPDVKMRLHSFLDKLVRDWGGKNVLVVTHQVPYILFRSMFEHLNEEKTLALGDVPNCGIQVYGIDTSEKKEGRMKIEDYNKVAY